LKRIGLGKFPTKRDWGGDDEEWRILITKEMEDEWDWGNYLPIVIEGDKE
jgi:hypothetical protein